MPETLTKLAPFMLRARVVANGREKLQKNAKRLAFLLVATDLSENSLAQAKRAFTCPIFQWGDSSQFQALFQFENTKILGVFKSSLADAVQPELEPFRINN